MNTVSVANRGFVATVPLLGAQGWIVPPVVGGPHAGFVALLRQWWLRSRTRDEIAELDEHLLRDIGLTRFDAMVESRKHFWQA